MQERGSQMKRCAVRHMIVLFAVIPVMIVAGSAYGTTSEEQKTLSCFGATPDQGQAGADTLDLSLGFETAGIITESTTINTADLTFDCDGISVVSATLNTAGLTFDENGIGEGSSTVNAVVRIEASAPDCEGDVTVRIEDGELVCEDAFTVYGSATTSTTTTVPLTTSTTTTVSPTTSTTTQPLTTVSSTTTTTAQVASVDFVANTTYGFVPLTVQFTNLSTGDIKDFRWNFGDNSTSTETDPAHTYSKEGNYTVMLYGTDADGEEVRKIKESYILVLPTVPCLLVSVLNDHEAAAELRKMRNALLRTRAGILPVSIYYRHAFEFGMILYDNEELQERLRSLVAGNEILVQRLAEGKKGVMAADQLDLLIAFLYEVKQFAGPAFQYDLQRLIDGMNSGYLLRVMNVMVQ